MNQYVTGSVIKRLREKLKLTQSQLADFLAVSDRTVSKWETGRGFPDITFLEPIAKILKVSVAELFSGAEIENGNRSANLSKLNFYVCPVCGEIFVSMNHEMTKTHYIFWFACVRIPWSLQKCTRNKTQKQDSETPENAKSTPTA